MGLRRSKLVSSRAADRTSTQHLNNGVEDAKVNAKCYETVARAHESFIQSVVVAAIKTLMLVRRWCRQTCRLFRHRFLISSTTDTGRLSLSLPLFLTLTLSLSLYLSIHPSRPAPNEFSRLNSFDLLSRPRFKDFHRSGYAMMNSNVDCRWSISRAIYRPLAGSSSANSCRDSWETASLSLPLNTFRYTLIVKCMYLSIHTCC